MSVDRPPAPRGAEAAALANSELFDELYRRFRDDPGSVDPSWRRFFEGFELGHRRPRTAVEAVPPIDPTEQSRVASLIYAYRNQGHLIAQINPLGNNPTSHPNLELARFGLDEEDLEETFDTGHLAGIEQRATLREILQVLRATYCRSIGVEYVHIQDIDERRWLQNEMEPRRNEPRLEREERLRILERLIDAEVFEKFTHTRYPGQKRFSLEGSEAVIPGLAGVVDRAARDGVVDIVMGMAHRGRLNVLANLLDKSLAMIFSEFEGNLPETVGGDGDVKYHKGYSSDYTSPDGDEIHLSLTSNPSHLEAVNPVVEGRARAKQRRIGDTDERQKVVPILLHGDAAFAGQGLVAETLNLSQLRGYKTGGTIHLIVNNQIGFTTLPSDARSTLYSTDVAKMIEAPIFHVNGDDPEAVVYVLELAYRYRQRFGRDVVVDVICYRRHGHNEGDEPAFTQPVLYKAISERPTTRQIYTERLVRDETISPDEGERIEERFKQQLQGCFDKAKEAPPSDGVEAFSDQWKGLDRPFSFAPVDTGASHDVLLDVARAMTTVPEGFQLNRKIARRLPKVWEAVESRGEVDWPTAELLAFGSLLHQGMPVRLAGQDSERGTFSQRHAKWHDPIGERGYVPLQNIHPEQARFCVYNSLLSEAAALGFEYGYSLDEPDMLIAWEAQFGDFANGAQVIIDQFIVAGHSKWQRSTGLVMLLPHGYEGQGPEHSNAYLERYLAAGAENNLQVCNLTTPAQYFHALRRQLSRPFRRPLVVMSPKSLLRHPLVVSPVDELIEGGFREILDDDGAPDEPRRLVLCSGKVYWDLVAARREREIDDVAIVRIEQLYPYHGERMEEIAARYDGVDEVVWAQEEPQNRGGWTFMLPRLLDLYDYKRIRYAGRPSAASPATGSHRVHKREQEKLVADALGG